jgi:ubiquinone/menaquinone biosynthesis C-methylase UbiE
MEAISNKKYKARGVKMKLNWAERWVVNNPLRVMEQRIELRNLSRMRPLKPGFTALEIGCGRGAGAGLILDIFRPSLLYATDLDVAMLKKAGKYISSEKKEHIVLAAGDGFSLPFRTESLDAVFDFGVLHHIPDWRSALGEVARVLKIQGTFYFEELYPTLYQNFITKHILLHPKEDRFSSQDLRNELDAAGLSLYRYREWKGFGILGVALKTQAEL